MDTQILEFGLENFKSYYGSQAVSFTDNGHDTRGITTFFGTNASGKTNLIEGVRTLRRLILCSEWNYSPFKMQLEASKKPTSFYIKFRYEEKIMRYDISYDSGKIVSEALLERSKNTNKYKIIFDRHIDELKICPGCNLTRATYKQLGEKESIISRLYTCRNEYGILVCDFLRRITIIDNESNHLGYIAANILRRDEQTRNMVADILNKSNVISSKIEAYNQQIPDFIIDNLNLPKAIKNELYRELKMTSSIRFAHKLWDGKKPVMENGRQKVVFTDIADESVGLRKLINILTVITNAMRERKIIIIDEFGTYLHAELIRKIIAFFRETERAKLILNTQSTEVLDLLRRENIIFIYKNSFEESIISPLGTNQARRQESFRKRYLQGDYGMLGEPGKNYLSDNWLHL